MANLESYNISICTNNCLPPVCLMTVEYELEPWGERSIVFLERALDIGEVGYLITFLFIYWHQEVENDGKKN